MAPSAGPRSGGIFAPLDHGRDLLYPNLVHEDVRCTLFGRFALPADEECPAGGGIKFTVRSTLRDALLFITLEFLKRDGKEANMQQLWLI